MSFPFRFKYLLSASTFAFDNSNSFVTFSFDWYFLIFSNTISSFSLTDKIKSMIASCCGFILIVLFKAMILSVTNPVFFDKGIEFFTIKGTPKFPLPINFCSSTSYSQSPIVSLFVDKLAPK